jgi:hypothetical protein
MITVQLFAKPKPNERHWYAYDVLLEGKIIVSHSRDPEHDLARALFAWGIKGVVRVIDGTTGRVRSRVNIQKAAPQGIGSNLDLYSWKSREIGKDSPHAGETTLLGIQIGEAA